MVTTLDPFKLALLMVEFETELPSAQNIYLKINKRIDDICLLLSKNSKGLMLYVIY
uniref:Uncharacterized protein n=1 Tax=Amphimedon queenslandica TaxID=400682 RepID=A0A1X7VS26_AMPQE